jgi:hypothetical protein
LRMFDTLDKGNHAIVGDRVNELEQLDQSIIQKVPEGRPSIR